MLQNYVLKTRQNLLFRTVTPVSHNGAFSFMQLPFRLQNLVSRVCTDFYVLTICMEITNIMLMFVS